ncbi:MAG: hypothetical protein ACJ77E_12910 [Gaiellaceae bacterium]
MATTAARATHHDLQDPTSFAGAFAYEHADIPPGVSLREYRCSRASRRSSFATFVHRVVERLATGRLDAEHDR